MKKSKTLSLASAFFASTMLLAGCSESDLVESEVLNGGRDECLHPYDPTITQDVISLDCWLDKDGNEAPYVYNIVNVEYATNIIEGPYPSYGHEDILKYVDNSALYDTTIVPNEYIKASMLLKLAVSTRIRADEYLMATINDIEDLKNTDSPLLDIYKEEWIKGVAQIVNEEVDKINGFDHYRSVTAFILDHETVEIRGRYFSDVEIDLIAGGTAENNVYVPGLYRVEFDCEDMTKLEAELNWLASLEFLKEDAPQYWAVPGHNQFSSADEEYGLHMLMMSTFTGVDGHEKLFVTESTEDPSYNYSAELVQKPQDPFFTLEKFTQGKILVLESGAAIGSPINGDGDFAEMRIRQGDIVLETLFDKMSVAWLDDSEKVENMTAGFKALLEFKAENEDDRETFLEMLQEYRKSGEIMAINNRTMEFIKTDNDPSARKSLTHNFYHHDRVQLRYGERDDSLKIPSGIAPPVSKKQSVEYLPQMDLAH